jgi:hypothetical protein
MHAHRLLGFRFYPFLLGAVALEIAWYPLISRRAYPWRERLRQLFGRPGNSLASAARQPAG